MGDYSWGGSEELWSQTALRLATRGVDVKANVEGWPYPAPQIAELVKAGCEITERKESPKFLSRALRKLNRTSVYDWLDHVHPDLVVVSQAGHYDGVEWASAALKRGLPYALIAQSAGEPWWPTDEMAAHVTAAYDGARGAFFVSQGNLDLARRQFAADLADAKVVRNPFKVPYDVFLEWPAETAPWKLACVGRLEPKAKGQDLLFEVLKSPKWRVRPLHVTLFGSGPNARTLETLRAKYQLDNVTFGGFVQDVTSIWKSHHALILPSRYEGLPLAVVEAMLCARPCIVTDVAGNAELVEDGINGFLAAAPSAALLDEALERAWEERTSWQAMGQAAAARVRQLIPPDPAGVFADEIMKLI